MKDKKILFGFVAIAALISLVLFFIDEGRHSFASLFSLGNLLPLLGLVVISSSVVALVYILLKKMDVSKRVSMFYSVFLGFPLGFFLGFSVLVKVSTLFYV